LGLVACGGGVDLRVSDDAVLPDHIAGGHRQGPRVAVVDDGQIVLERTLIDVDEVVGQLEPDSKRFCDRSVRVNQCGKPTLVRRKTLRMCKAFCIESAASYVGIRSGKSALELGGGMTLLHASGTANAAGVATSGSGIVPFGVAMIG
jgi:hypothetical protein